MVACSGCATLVSGQHDEVAIRSNPPQAYVSVRNDNGEMVASGTTPMKVELKRTKGALRLPVHYTATLEKPGYTSKQIEIDPRINPWVAGNLLLGGPIGLIADAASGAAWRMSPDEINTQLSPMRRPRMTHHQPTTDVQQVTYVTDE